MARHRHLSRAPLREALIDLQFEPVVSMEAIDRFVASLEPPYSKKLDLWETVFGLSSDGQGSAAHTSHRAIGRRLESTQDPWVLQCRVSGFTLSRLSPYGEWPDLQNEARRLWDAFQAHVGRLTVSRIAVRYINEIKLPVPIRDFSDYLTSPPRIPEALPQAVSGFLTRVVIPDASRDCVSIVTQALEAPPAEGVAGTSITILLDIDVFRSVQINARDDSLWSGLKALRDQKNRMFFEHVTEATVGLYE